MNLDQLTERIKSSTSEKPADGLAHWIEEWKKADRTVDQLVYMVEKFFGNVWFEKEEDNKTCYNLWKEFKENKIADLNGMTINERLYNFGLFDIYD